MSARHYIRYHATKESPRIRSTTIGRSSFEFFFLNRVLRERRFKKFRRENRASVASLFEVRLSRVRDFPGQGRLTFIQKIPKTVYSPLSKSDVKRSNAEETRCLLIRIKWNRFRRADVSARFASKTDTTIFFLN